MPAALQLSELYRPIEPHLDAVRADVGAMWTQMLGFVDASAPAPPAMGGKLLRPALCLLAGGASGARDMGALVPMAGAMEMFHLAALAHDDVLDAANLRRGTTSLNAMWDNHAAVLGGDYLVARGVSQLTAYGDCDLISNAIDCIRVMAEGELTDYGLGPGAFTREGCLSLARAKTATLFAVACSSPCYVVGRAHRDALYAFGMNLGTAFQIVDDLLDLTQDEAMLGKPACGDVVEGKKTLPLLYMRDGLDAAGIARLERMRGGELTASDHAWVAEALETTGALARTEAEARAFVDEAVKRLKSLPPSEYRETMTNLAEFVLVRGS